MKCAVNKYKNGCRVSADFWGTFFGKVLAMLQSLSEISKVRHSVALFCDMELVSHSYIHVTAPSIAGFPHPMLDQPDLRTAQSYALN